MVAFGVLKGGKYKDPETLTEALEGRNILEIVESEDNSILPISWIEHYNNKVHNDLLSNPHNYLDDPLGKYNKMLNFISKYNVQQDFYPSKYQVDISSSFTLNSLLKLDFDYILLPDKTRILSRKNKKFFIPLCSETSIKFSVRNQKFIMDTQSNVLKTIINIKENKVACNIYSKSDILKKYNYQGVISNWVSKRWNVSEFANIITNHNIISNFCCIDENSQCIEDDVKKRIKIVFQNLFSKTEPVIFLNYSSDHLNIKIKNCPCPKEYNLISKLFMCILQVYEDTIQEEVEVNYNLLSILRIVDSELFVENYTRECSVLPIPLILDQESGLKYILDNHIFPDQTIDYSKAIEYPLGSKNYYTAPEGYSPGLKRNRLKNRDKYKYVITCYKKNHLEIPGKITHNYYENNCNSNKIHSLEECILEAGYTRNNNLDVYECVLFQDVYNQEIDIENVSSLEDHLLYRYYEEAYNVNIILLDYSSIYITKCPKPYFWDYNTEREVVFVNKKNSNSFHLLQMSRSKQVKWIEEKILVTQRSQTNFNISKVTAQYVDINGKRRMILEDNVWKQSIGAPLNLPHLDYVNQDLLDAEFISESIHKKLNIPNKLPLCSNRKFLVC